MALEILGEITLNLARPNDLVVVHAKQYDASSRKITVNLQNGNTSWAVPEGASGVVRYRKPDNTIGFYDTDEFDNAAIVVDSSDKSKLTVTLSIQALTCPGRVLAEINFFDLNGAKLSTFAFAIDVERSAAGDDEIISEDYVNGLTALIQQIIESAVAEGDVIIDRTLSIQGAAADAKATGDRITATRTELINYVDTHTPEVVIEVDKTLTVSDAAADSKTVGDRLRTDEANIASNRTAIQTLDDAIDDVNLDLGDLNTDVTDLTDSVDSIQLMTTTGTSGDGRTFVTLQLYKDGKPFGNSSQFMIDGDLTVTGEISAQALYADMGDIADLRVSELSTSRRIPKYLVGRVADLEGYGTYDLTDDNYIDIHEKFFNWVTGTVSITEDTPDQEQAKDPYGVPLYWESNPYASGVTLSASGYPYYDGQRIYITRTRTDYPVIVYTYTELVKASIEFEKLSGTEVYVPVLTMGAGDLDGNDKLTMAKKQGGLEMYYAASGGDIIGLKAGLDGYLDLYGLRSPTAIDFSGWDSGNTFGVTYQGGKSANFSVMKDSNGRPTKITSNGIDCTITW